MVLLIENNISGGTSSVMGDRYAKSDEIKKILYLDAALLYCHSMSQLLSVDEIKVERNVCSKKILNTPNDSDMGFFGS